MLFESILLLKGVSYKAQTSHLTRYPPSSELTPSVVVMCSLLGPLGLEFPLESLHALLQLSDGSLELLVVGLEGVDVAFLRRAEASLDKIDRILGFLWLLVESDEDLGQLVDDAGLL